MHLTVPEQSMVRCTCYAFYARSHRLSVLLLWASVQAAEREAERER